MITPHWTDHAAEPVFTTIIRADGPGGNVYDVLATACSMLGHLDIPPDRIERLRADVGTAINYEQAVAFIEHWFPVKRG